MAAAGVAPYGHPPGPTGPSQLSEFTGIGRRSDRYDLALALFASELSILRQVRPNLPA
jgi:hypothetical protein